MSTIAQNQLRASYLPIITTSATAPSTFSLGDVYYNTTTYLLYTAIKNDNDEVVWGDGETPLEGHLYLSIDSNVFYGVSNGRLVAGAGSGSITNPVSVNIDMNYDYKIINLKDGSSAQDAVNKSQLDTKADLTDVVLLSEKGVANGVATLDSNGTIPDTYLNTATTQKLGIVKVDGVTTTVDIDGTVSAVQPDIYRPPLLQAIWSDHIINQVSWLRSDTFSWQDGGVYSAAYNHLLNDITNNTYTKLYAWMQTTSPNTIVYTASSNPSLGEGMYGDGDIFVTSGIIGGRKLYTIEVTDNNAIGLSDGTWFSRYAGFDITGNFLLLEEDGSYIALDGHRIFASVEHVGGYNIYDLEDIAINYYNTMGIAWYYILDTENERFKLPRTKYGFTGLRDSAGKYVPESLPNIKGDISVVLQGSQRHNSGALYYGDNDTADKNGNSSSAPKVSFDASLYSSTYQDDAPVQQRATQMYLYFYVGSYAETAIEQTAGLNAELFNDKADVSALNNKANTDLSNVLASIDYVIDSKSPTQADPTWYRKYKSGWVEQGGKSSGIPGSGSLTIYFSVEMADTNYSVYGGVVPTSTSAGDARLFANNLSTTSMDIDWTNGNYTDSTWWEVKGQGA